MTSEVSPYNLATYLVARGWTEGASYKGKWAEFVRDGAEVSVVFDTTDRYFGRRLDETLHNLTIVENRPRDQIVEDIALLAFDVVRHHFGNGRTDSLPLLALPKSARAITGLMLAGALAAEESRAAYSGRRSGQVNAFLNRLRLGHTEHGSFVLRVLSEIDQTDTLAHIEPFGRRAVRTVAEALEMAIGVTYTAIATNEITVGDDLVEKGVSANLCAAAADLCEVGGTEPITISFSWSPRFPRPEIEQVRLTREDGQVLKDMARQLRERALLSLDEISGRVVHLHSEDPNARGVATVRGELAARTVHVEITLGASDYSKAIDAHETGRAVRAIGAVSQQGRWLRMDECQRFERAEQESLTLWGEDD